MCPSDCPGLDECWGEEFEKLYTRCRWRLYVLLDEFNLQCADADLKWGGGMSEKHLSADELLKLGYNHPSDSVFVGASTLSDMRRRAGSSGW